MSWCPKARPKNSGLLSSSLVYCLDIGLYRATERRSKGLEG